MQYYQYNDQDETFGHGFTYIEVDHNQVLRQLSLFDSRTITSNVKHPVWGFILTDQPLDAQATEFLSPIEQDRFEALWQQHLNQHLRQWHQIKTNYPTGSNFEGYIEVFYPQGVIINSKLSRMSRIVRTRVFVSTP